ncbi:hypothetical protein [Bacillus velezensis]|uniref:hypothetical protein n=1 Tax=Bacillus velezensis TaxID=492670 RepID=UPI003EBBA201
MTEDFYCDEVLSGKIKVNKVLKTENVFGVSSYKTFLAEVHFVVIPKNTSLL